jgi:hypothetical protein
MRAPCLNHRILLDSVIPAELPHPSRTIKTDSQQNDRPRAGRSGARLASKSSPTGLAAKIKRLD